MSSPCALVNLFRAIKINDVETVRDILSKNPEMICPSYYSDFTTKKPPFWKAMFQGYEKIVELFLDFGADPNEIFFFKRKSMFNGLTFLHCLPALNDWESYKKVAEVLLRRGANVNYHSETLGHTPIELAILAGNVQCIDFLLKNGARLDEGLSEKPLFLLLILLSAPKTKQMEMMQLLIEAGLNVKVRFESTGLDYLHTTIVHAISEPDKVDVLGISKVLLDSRVSANSLDNDGVSVLIRSFLLQNVELVSLLIEKGADANMKIELQGCELFPLHAAAFNKNTAILGLLLSNGAEINAKSDKGITALHVACSRGYKETINFLIKKGAHISDESVNGITPFYLLEPHKFEESKVSCINIMIKEIAKKKFDNDFAVSKKDFDLMESHPEVKKYFQSCTKELFKMSRVKFYAWYSYYFVLRISKNQIKKLENLTKNEEFVVNFSKNLHTFSHYNNDLQDVMNEAIQSRDRSLIVEFRLKSVFADSLPDTVIKKLVDNLNVEDLLQ